MRQAAFAAAAAFGLALALAPASAQSEADEAEDAVETIDWNDPAGRFKVQLPGDWPIDIRPADGFSYVIAGDQFGQCQFIATPRPSTADARPDMLLTSTTEPISPDAWQSVMGAMDGLFQGQGQLITQSVDIANFWPIQRARLRAPFGPLQGAIYFRPGLEIWTFCTTPGNIEAGDRFEPIIQSVGTAQDEFLQAEAVRLKAEAEAEYARIQAAHEAALAAIRAQQAEAAAEQERRSSRRRRRE